MPCSNCKFSAEAPKAGMVSCKRYPPVINPSNPCVPPQSVFPTLSRNDGCGEYQMVASVRQDETVVLTAAPHPVPMENTKRRFFGRIGWLG